MHETFFQSLAFKELQEKIPYRGKSWMLEEKGTKCLVVRAKLPLGFSWLWIPYGPLNESGEGVKEIFDEVERIARREKSLFVRVEPPLGWPEIETKKLSVMWRTAPAPHRFTPECSLELDLTKDEKAILAQMKPKGRYNISVAKRHGVVVKPYHSFEKIPKKDFEALYMLLQKTGKRDGFGIHPKYFYETLIQTFEDHKCVTVFIAYKDDEVVAGSINIYFKDTATYYYGASSYEHRNLMAPCIVQWTAILEAKEKGMKAYDFLGIAPPNAKDHPWAGVTDFKKKFGGQIVEYPRAFDIIYRPALYYLKRFLRR